MYSVVALIIVAIDGILGVREVMFVGDYHDATAQPTAQFHMDAAWAGLIDWTCI